MKGRPKKVRIGVHTYSIEWDLEGDAEFIGETSNAKLSIRIRPDLAFSMAQETLLHEILHAVWYCSSVRLNAAIDASFGGRSNEFDPEEHVIDCIDGLLLQVLQDNVKLAAWLVATVE